VPWPAYTEGIRLRLIKALLSSNSRYAALMVTELFDLEDQFNRPGTTDVDNWRFRLPWTLTEIRENPELEGNCQKLACLIGITRRD
jgi:4-alpha-glucanotransferase